MDIFDQLGDIPGVREFHAESAPLAIPAAQRVREFLSERAGALWLSARIVSYPAGGALVHIASAPMSSLKNATALLIVVESLDGSFSLPGPLEDDSYPLQLAGAPSGGAHSDVRSEEYRKERECLDRILPALAEIGKILAADESIKQRRKKRLLTQLTHAVGHLLSHLESLMEE